MRWRVESAPRKKGAGIEQIRLACFERDALAQVPIMRLSPSDIASYRDRRMMVVAGETVRRELALLNSVIQTARTDWGIPISSNPVSLVKKPASSPARKRRLQGDELELLQRALLKARNDGFRDVVGFALETAMRRSELLALTWSDIDLESGIARLLEGKNGHGRSVPLSKAAQDILRKRQSSESQGVKVFPLTPNAVRLAWERTTRRAEIADLHFHDLRHEAISRSFERGLSIAEVALISGHRDVRMLFRYTHLRAEDVAKKLI